MHRPTEISTSDPTVNDDALNGYFQGLGWLNTTSGAYFVCKDDAVGAAVWTEVSASAEISAWANWTPTFTWSAGSPNVSYVARYIKIGTKINFTLLVQVYNNTGGAITSWSCTLPETPADTNQFIPIYSQYSIVAMSSVADIYGDMAFAIDCSSASDTARKLYNVATYSQADEDTYTWIMEGFYEVSS